MKQYTGIFCILSAIILILSFSACNEKAENIETDETILINEQWDKTLLEANPKDKTYTYYFESVEALLSAIKHDPNKYDNTNIKVIGTIYKNSDISILVDFKMDSANMPVFSRDGGGLMAELEADRAIINSAYKINFVISNTAQSAVAEKYDYVKVYGTVKLQENNIHIIGEYSLIATKDERIQNINDQK